MHEIHKLRPKPLVAERQRMPVAYFGLGILEWHGLHNPLGLDGVKANGIACHLAEQLGGIVFPPLYWGDHRREICEVVFDDTISPWLPPGTGNHTLDICQHMGIHKSSFVDDAFRSERNGGWALWERLMIHNLFQIQTLGFKLIVLIPGHYPLFNPVKRAIAKYREEGGKSAVFSLQDNLYEEESGDHAAAFETSLMLALEPELVDLTELNPDPEQPLVGVLGKDPRQYANRELGLRILEKFTELTREQIHQAGLG